MTDRAQFEAMLEALINDDQATAKEIFHNIVVGKSREIYEELLESDFSENIDQGNPYKESSEEEEEEGEEEEGKEKNPFGGDDEEGEEDGEEDGEDDGEDDGEEGDDADGEENPFGDEEGEEDGEGEGDIEDRVMDLEDALEDLKAEFEQLLAGEEHEEEKEPGVHGAGNPMHDLAAQVSGSDDLEAERMMEYTIKVGKPQHGDNGLNTKSTIDNMKNDMGGTTANIAQSFSTTSGGTQGGLAKPTTEDLTKGLGDIQNRPGIAKSKSFTKKEPGHGPEKKGAAPGGEVGSKNTSGRGDSNTKSTIGKRVR